MAPTPEEMVPLYERFAIPQFTVGDHTTEVLLPSSASSLHSAMIEESDVLQMSKDQQAAAAFITFSEAETVQGSEISENSAHFASSVYSKETLSAEQLKPYKWPRGPVTLREGRGSIAASVTKDCAFLILPVLFITLAAIASSLDGQPILDYGGNVQAATKLGPTIFPIFFAAIVSRTVRSLARKLLERGQTLGVLEQLVGSQSLAGTLAWLIDLRHTHIVGIVTFAVWALSPLGGQSALRLLAVTHVPINSTLEVSYYQAGNPGQSFLSGSDVARYQAAMVSHFAAALLGADKNKKDSFDMWGNPKIPVLETLSEEASDGWRSVTTRSPIQFSSLIGVRLQGLCSDCNITFSIETAYNDLSCHNIGRHVPGRNVTDFLLSTTGSNVNSWNPIIDPVLPFGDQGRGTRSSILATNSFSPLPNETQTIYYITHEESYTASLYTCNMGTTRLECEVYCRGASYMITRARKSLKNRRPRNWSNYEGKSYELSMLMSYFSTASGPTRWDLASATDNFIAGYTLPYNLTPNHDWKGVPDEDLSQRLTLVFNAFQDVVQAPYSITSGKTFEPLICHPDSWGTPDGTTMFDNCQHMNFTTATVSRDKAVYQASPLWVALLLVSSFTLLLLGILTIILHFTTAAPDVLGYVSTMTRDSSYFKDLPAATTLDGPTRSRALRNVRVQLADVKAEEETGRIALRTLGKGERGLKGRLGEQNKSRLYE